jgi:DNA transformation protein
MTSEEGLRDWVEEALAPIGRLSARRMMGGATLYCDGTIFAILHAGEIWFKSDAIADSHWDEAGCERFALTMKGGRVDVMNYRRGPAEVSDEAEAMQRCAALALEAGTRGLSRRKPRRRPAKEAAPF